MTAPRARPIPHAIGLDTADAQSDRILHGPTLPDRVVALDLISILTAGSAAVYAIAAGEAVFLDVALILALISFLGTVAFARYLERQAFNQ
jgi:multicomponent Na+:H+ antiporter subunit F